MIPLFCTLFITLSSVQGANDLLRKTDKKMAYRGCPCYNRAKNLGVEVQGEGNREMEDGEGSAEGGVHTCNHLECQDWEVGIRKSPPTH